MNAIICFREALQTVPWDVLLFFDAGHRKRGHHVFRHPVQQEVRFRCCG